MIQFFRIMRYRHQGGQFSHVINNIVGSLKPCSSLWAHVPLFPVLYHRKVAVEVPHPSIITNAKANFSEHKFFVLRVTFIEAGEVWLNVAFMLSTTRLSGPGMLYTGRSGTAGLLGSVTPMFLIPCASRSWINHLQSRNLGNDSVEAGKEPKNICQTDVIVLVN